MIRMARTTSSSDAFRSPAGRGGKRNNIKASVLIIGAIQLFANVALGADKHPFNLHDLHRIRAIAEPSISPDGRWIAYTVSEHNVQADKTVSELWRVSVDGKREQRLTVAGEHSDYTPQWSPDGRWLAFLSDRGDDETAQVWLMRSAGGAARALTAMKGGVSDFVWAPDSRELALIAADDPDPANGNAESGKGAAGKSKKTPQTAKPIVLDRYQFKDDDSGYLDHHRSHLYLFDIARRAPTLLTPGDHDEWTPAWSPDGKSIVYVSKRGTDPDRSLDSNLYLIAARAGAQQRQLTRFPGSDMDPYWEVAHPGVPTVVTSLICAAAKTAGSTTRPGSWRWSMSTLARSGYRRRSTVASTSRSGRRMASPCTR